MRVAATLVVAGVLGVFVVGSASAQIVDELSRRRALEHYRAGQEFMTSERYPEAVEEFSSATELDPLLTLAHYGLGQGYMALKRYASAIQAFTTCREAYARIGALRQSDVQSAERRLDDETRELRDSLVRVRTGQIKGAGPALEQQLERRLDELETMRKGRGAERLHAPAEVWLALGSAYYRNGQQQDAEREWLEAVRLNSRLGEAHNNLAVLYMQTGRKQQAEDAVRAAERARFRVNPQLKADIGKMK